MKKIFLFFCVFAFLIILGCFQTPGIDDDDNSTIISTTIPNNDSSTTTSNPSSVTTVPPVSMNKLPGKYGLKIPASI